VNRTSAPRSGPFSRPRAIGLLGGLGLAGWWLWHLGRGALALPAFDRPAEWAGWVDRVGAVGAAFAVVRLLCLLATAYLAVCALVAIVAGRSRHEGVRRLARLICVPPARRLLEGALGVGIGVGALTAVALPLAPAGATSLAGPTMRAAGPAMTLRATGAAAPSMTLRAARGGITRPTMTLRAADSAGGTRPTMTLRASGLDAAAPASPPSVEPPAPTTSPADAPVSTPEPQAHARPTGDTDYVVEAGDHFWRIAERTLAASTGQEPGDAEVDAYWRRLVEANASRLSDPANPDLLFAGQVLVLPAP
jgi:LysM domain